MIHSQKKQDEDVVPQFWEHLDQDGFPFETLKSGS